jgi:cell division septation protein DedD
LAATTSEGAPLNEDGFHEIQLSGKQLVFLFMATTIVAVVIFLCGVQVGRGVRNDRVQDNSDAIAAAAPAPTPTSSSSTAQPAAGSSGQPAAEPPAPAQEPDDELSYAKRLQGDSAPQEQLKTEPAAPQTDTAVSRRSPEGAKAEPQSRRSAEGAKADAKTPSPAPSAPALETKSQPQPGNWVVQVHALKDRAAATKIAQGLAAKGYPAFVLDPEPGSPAIYRVQVGRYGDRREAEQVAHRLEKDEQYKPIIHSVK